MLRGTGLLAAGSCTTCRTGHVHTTLSRTSGKLMDKVNAAIVVVAGLDVCGPGLPLSPVGGTRRTV